MLTADHIGGLFAQLKTPAKYYVELDAFLTAETQFADCFLIGGNAWSKFARTKTHKALKRNRDATTALRGLVGTLYGLPVFTDAYNLRIQNAKIADYIFAASMSGDGSAQNASPTIQNTAAFMFVQPTEVKRDERFDKPVQS